MLIGYFGLRNPERSMQTAIWSFVGAFIWLLISLRELVRTLQEHRELRLEARRSLWFVSTTGTIRLTWNQAACLFGPFIGACANLYVAHGILAWVHAFQRQIDWTSAHGNGLGAGIATMFLAVCILLIAVSWLPGSLAWLIATARDLHFAWRISRR